MLQVAEAIRRMQVQLGAFREAPLRSDPHRTLSNLRRVVDQMERAIGSGAVPKPPLDPTAVWHEWSSRNFAPEVMNRTQWRTLCTSPATALRPELVSCLIRDPEPLWRLVNFLGIAHTYFHAWRPNGEEMADAAMVERLLWSQLDGYHRTSRNRVLVSWRSFPFLFSSEAANRVAEQSLANRHSVEEFGNRTFIDKESRLLIRATEVTASLEVKTLVAAERRIDAEAALKRLEWLRDNALPASLSPAIYRECMAQLVLSQLPERFNAFRRLLVQTVYADKRLRDPRLVDAAPNWRQVSQRAREMFLSWLAEETLQFFFDTIVPRNDENRRRAEFWLRYAKRYGNIKDFQVAVSDDDIGKIERSRGPNTPAFARVNAPRSAASSAFVMAFEGHGEQYIIVEFSETGRAACIYRRAQFESNGVNLRLRRFDMDDLWDTSRRLDSINHHRNSQWEARAAYKLAGMGITA